MLGRWQPWHDGHQKLFETLKNRQEHYGKRCKGVEITLLILKQLKKIF